MQNDNNNTCAITRASTISVFPGVAMNIALESHADYLEMRAAQLSALNHLLTSGDFEAWNSTIKADAKWLAASLAAEVSQLVTVVTFGENLNPTKEKV